MEPVTKGFREGAHLVGGFRPGTARKIKRSAHRRERQAARRAIEAGDFESAEGLIKAPATERNSS